MRWTYNDLHLPLVDNRRIFVAISAVLIVTALAITATRGINFGIDFAGGYELQAHFDQEVDDGRIKHALRKLEMGEPVVQRFGGREANEYLIRIKSYRSVDPAKLQAIRADLEGTVGKDKLLGFHYSTENGERVQVELATAVEASAISAAFAAKGLAVQEVLASTRQDKPLFTVILPSVSTKVEQLLRQEFNLPALTGAPDERPLLGRVEYVGPQVGAQLRNQGLLAVLYSLLFLMIYIAIRFDFYFAPGAIASLAHDVLITIGVFSLFQIEFNLPVIAALLTLVGYSLNDTIVVYDRIRENVVKLRGRDTENLVNTSINETLSRTTLTSLVTALGVLSLLLFGGGSIFEFALAMMIGIVVGTYSSIAIAAPTYIWLKQRFGGAKAA